MSEAEDARWAEIRRGAGERLEASLAAHLAEGGMDTARAKEVAAELHALAMKLGREMRQ